MAPCHSVLATSSFSRQAVGWLSLAGDALASIFFPADCRICQALLLTASRIPICAPCLASLTPVPLRICDVCGLPLESLQPPVPGDFPEHVSEDAPVAPVAPVALVALHCPNCAPPRFAFAAARSLAIYQDTTVSAVLILKYQRLDPLAKWFALRLAELARKQDERFAADIVVPVPLHPARLKDRGHNQAALIAKPLAAALGLPFRRNALTRIRERPAKGVLSIEERWQAVSGAFATHPGTQVDKSRVLLVDDVLTTGATLDACARALLGAGAKSVVGLTVARAARSLVTRSSPQPGQGSPSKSS